MPNGSIQSRTITTFTFTPLNSNNKQTVELDSEEAIIWHVLYLINNTIQAIERELNRAKRQLNNDATIARLTAMLEAERMHSTSTIEAVFKISRLPASYLLEFTTEGANVYDEMDILVDYAQRSQE